jgi:hypothetical protein
MNPIAVALDVLLAALLLAALALGARLNARLKTLRDSQAGFAAAVLELNQAAARAEAGLASLRAASEDTHDALLTRIETARALTLRLEQATAQAEKASRLAPPPPAAAAPRSDPSSAPLPRGSLAELAASLKARRSDTPAMAPPPRPTPAARRTTPDDDLFEGGSDRTPAPGASGLRRQRDDKR